MAISLEVFCCYAREDQEMLLILKRHLAPLVRRGLIHIWSDTDLNAGVEWEKELQNHLERADIILLLISSYFIDSDYCYSTEMLRAIERHEQGSAKVIPILLSATFWRDAPFAKLQMVPKNARPVKDKSWFDLDEAFNDVTRQVAQVVEDVLTHRLVDQKEGAMSLSESTIPTIPKMVAPHIGKDLSTSKYDNGTQITTESHDISSPAQQEKTHAFSPLALETSKLVLTRTLAGHTNYINSVVISADGQTLISGSWDKTIKTWDLSTGREVHTLTGHKDAVTSVAISPNGQSFASGSTDHTIKLWDLSTGEEVRTLTSHKSGVFSVAISGNGQTLVSGSADKTIKVWDLSTGREVRTLTGHRGIVMSVAISADGQTLVSGSEDKTIKVWDLSTGREVRTLTPYVASFRFDGAVYSVALSADGRILVSGGSNRTLKVWDLSIGEVIYTLSGHKWAIWSVALSANGRTLASGSVDHTIKLWNLSTGKEISTLTNHTEQVRSVAISADGQTLASGSEDKTIKVWRAQINY